MKDRISCLPQETIEKILSLMPLEDAVRTSILSTKWRHLWTGIPKLEIVDDRQRDDELKFVTTIFHVLLLRRAPILEFSLRLSDKEIFSQIDLIILHLSRTNANNIKKFTLDVYAPYESYSLPTSFFSLQRIEHLDLSFCQFTLPSILNKGFSRLRTLRFDDVFGEKMVPGFLANCPLLEDFTWTRDGSQIDIELTDGEFVELFTGLPSIQVLELSMVKIQHLAGGSMPRQLPISLVHLRTLNLEVCFLDLSAVLCVICSSPNLEKFSLQLCWEDQHPDQCVQRTFNNLFDVQAYTGLFNLDHFKKLEITHCRDHGFCMEFVKLVLARSPMLEKATIDVYSSVSVGKEDEMDRDLRLSCASPTTQLIIYHTFSNTMFLDDPV